MEETDLWPISFCMKELSPEPCYMPPRTLQTTSSWPRAAWTLRETVTLAPYLGVSQNSPPPTSYAPVSHPPHPWLAHPL